DDRAGRLVAMAADHAVAEQATGNGANDGARRAVAAAALIVAIAAIIILVAHAIVVTAIVTVITVVTVVTLVVTIIALLIAAMTVPIVAGLRRRGGDGAGPQGQCGAKSDEGASRHVSILSGRTAWPASLP